MKKSLFYTTLLLTLINSTPAFSGTLSLGAKVPCFLDPYIIFGCFFIIPLIEGLIISFASKRNNEPITPHQLINQTFKISATTLAILAFIFNDDIDSYTTTFKLIILSILFAFLNIKELPNPENNKIKTFLSKAIMTIIIGFQCIILLLYSAIIGFYSDYGFNNIGACELHLLSHSEVKNNHSKYRDM